MQPSACTLQEPADAPRFEDDDGNVYYGAEATRRANAYFAEIEARNRAYVQRLTPQQRKQLERILRERATPVGAQQSWDPNELSSETRPATSTGGRQPRRRSSTQRSSARSGDSPGEGGPGGGAWPLSFVDRAPVLWRFRALRCRLLEIREGVDR